MSRRVLDIILLVLLVGAVTPVTVAAFIFLPVIILFGSDPPGQTHAGYMLAVMQPVLFVAGAIGLSVIARLMFERGRVIAALGLAAAFFAAVWYLIFIWWR